MNKVQLSGKIARIRIDEYQGKIANVEFSLSHLPSNNFKYLAPIKHLQWYRCYAYGHIAEQLSKSLMDDKEVILEGIILNKIACPENAYSKCELQIHISDMLVLPKK
jgi:hypothetical protein